MNKNCSFVEIDWQPSGRGDFACPDGEAESIVVSRDGTWINPDSVKGLGISDSAETTVIVSESSSGSSLTPGGLYTTTTITTSDTPPLDLPQPPDMGKPAAVIPDIFLPQVPLVEFSLTPKAVTPFSLLDNQWPQTELNLPVATSDPNLNSLLTDEATTFIDDYEAACRDQKLFTAPFLVMAAVRFPDGTLVPGVPVLMIPNSETPVLTIETVGSSERATGVRLRLLSRACQLRMRLFEAAPLSEHYKGCRLEILIGGPISLRRPGPYDVRAPHTVYARGYSVTEESVLTASDGGRLTGLNLGNVTRDEIDGAISSISEFRIIASLPFENISDYSAPTPVTITGNLNNISSSAENTHGIVPDFSLLMRHNPAYTAKVNSRMLLMGGECQPPLPTPLRGSAATGSRSGLLQEVTLEVELIKGGKRIRRRLSPDSAVGENSPYVMHDLENHFPRFIFYPDPDAILLRIYTRIGGATRIRTLPLTRHEQLGGACWFRGLNGDSPSYSTGELPAGPSAGETAYPTPWLTSVSKVTYDDTGTWLFPENGRVRCGDAHVVGATAAIRSLSSGQLGVFPLQLFTDGGIWAVAHDEATGGFHAVQPVGMHHCVNPGAIVPTPQGTVFCTLSGVMLLNGTQVKTLSEGCPAQFSPQFLTSCRIWYDAGREHLHLFLPESTRTEVYCLLTGKWIGYTDTDRSSSGSGGLSGGIGDLRPVFPPDILPGVGQEWSGTLPEGEKWWQLTLRPLKMKKPHSRKRLRGIEVVGAEAADVRVRLWGATVSGEWHPLAEGKREVRSLFGSGWRLFRVSVLYRAAERRSVEGLMVTTG